MKTVNISDLKAQHSAHIQLVKDGEEVLVCDGNKPVARIVPCHLTDLSEQEQRLVARGVLTLPLKKRPASVSWPEPPGNVSDEVMEQVRREERGRRQCESPPSWKPVCLFLSVCGRASRPGLLACIRATTHWAGRLRRARLRGALPDVCA